VANERRSSSIAGPPVAGRPVLDRSDESFLENLLSEDGPAPPLPPRVTMPELDWPSDDASSVHKSQSAENTVSTTDRGKEGPKDAKEETKKPNRFSQVFSRVGRNKSKHGDTLKPEDAKTATTSAVESEEEREKKDLSQS
jgi:hypothetical protein